MAPVRLEPGADDLDREPWRYPGRPVERSSVLRGDSLHALSVKPGRRLGQARVETADGLSGVSLSEYLLEANVAAIDQRTLVVAVGSNASPAVMLRKFVRKGVSTTLPLVTADLAGVAVGHSAHVSKRGYIAAAPYAQAGESSQVVVSLLDAVQLACLDDSESNYERRLFTHNRFPLTLDGGETPAEFFVYVSEWDVLAADKVTVDHMRSQDDIFGSLFSRSARLHSLVDDVTPRSALAMLAAHAPLREAFRSMMAAEGFVRPSGLKELPPKQPRVYGDTPARWNTKHSPMSLRCIPSSDAHRRLGEQIVVLHPRDHAEKLSGAGHAAVTTCAEPRVGSALARVVVSDKQVPGCVEVDQILRCAIGVELQEHVELSARHVRATPFADHLLARPQFVTMRVQTGDLTIVEQGVCLMDALSMRIIGIDDGAKVLIQTSVGSKRIAEIRLRAYATPEDTTDRRVDLSGGGLEARFPAAGEVLGITPDLPWIFLDSAARSKLVLKQQKLGTVRVRAARRYQVLKELRELLLVIAIALIGVSTALDSAVVVSLFAGALTVAIGLLIRNRLKSRLEATS